MVFVGSTGTPPASFPNPPETVVGQTPVIREKPFLYVDSGGSYNVFVPALRQNPSGTSWGHGAPAGQSISLSEFYVAHPADSAATLDAALAAGKNLLVTPGVYHLDQALNVTRPDTVVLGLGLATLMPTTGTAAITTSDVDGVKIAGLLIDAGAVNSPVLVQVGQPGSNANHAADPASLHDVFFRIGGAAVGKATQTLVVNSNNVLGDHLWGLGSYCFFNSNPSLVAGHSFEVPDNGGVRFHNLVSVSLGGVGTIAHVINDSGDAANTGHQVSPLVSYP